MSVRSPNYTPCLCAAPLLVHYIHMSPASTTEAASILCLYVYLVLRPSHSISGGGLVFWLYQNEVPDPEVVYYH